MKKIFSILTCFSLILTCFGVINTPVRAEEAWLWPIEIKHTFTTYRGHKGIDIAVPIGTPVRASKSGTLYVENNKCNGNHNTSTYARIGCTVSGCKSKTGKCVYIYHGDGTLSCYMHLNELKYSKTTEVKQGDIIGYVGNTGPSTGPHLHFEIAYGNSKTNYWGNSRITNGIANSNTDFVTYIYETHTCSSYETYTNGTTKILGACIDASCRKPFNWQDTFSRITDKTASLKSSKKNYKINVYNAPYEDATKTTAKKPVETFAIVGTVKNAYGNEWYAIDYPDNDKKVCYIAYIYKSTLTDNYDIITSNYTDVVRFENAAVIDKEHSHNYNYNNGQCYCGAVKATTQQTNAASTLKINLTKYPVQHTQGNNFGLRGTISSNYKIKKIYGYIKQNGNIIQSTEDSPNAKTVNVKEKRLNNNLIFETLGAGNYTLEVYAVDASGNGLTVTKNFTVVGETVEAESTLSINLDKYPVTLNVGSSYGLRGSITSNYNISVVRGYVINSNGQTVLSSKDTPNSTYMDIKPAHLNADLIFNNLSAGNYTMKVVAVDASGRTVEARKNFTVKAKDVYVDNSPNGNGVTGTVAIPSSWENLSIRSGPSTNYQIVGSMNNGAKCTVYPNKTSNGWYYVNYNGIWGYASGNQINLNSSTTSITRTGIVNIPSSWTDLSIRTGPSTNYQIVGGMPHGARCTVYPDKASNGWYYVEYNGVSGYAAGNRINLQ